ncbi:MAG TPA: sulfite exporter TauE/SafE family protein [Polyangiaceae bacterium]
MDLDTASLVLIVITALAAVVNGALGYGFSSLTVPVALLFYTNRVLNPTMVMVEVVINVFVLLMNRDSIPAVWRRVLPIILGLLPGVWLGSQLLTSLHPAWIKCITYVLLLPLIFFQAAGIRRPIRSERLVGVPFGAGVGFLYSVTTISGPPLAVLFNNQGLVKKDFRAALGMIRVAESSVTAFAYYQLGLFTQESMSLVPLIAPSVVLGIPLGTILIRRLDAETFRRVCMSFDVWIVGFGLSRVLAELALVALPQAYGVLGLCAALDAWLLYVFFKKRSAGLRQTMPPVGLVSVSPPKIDPVRAPLDSPPRHH